MLDVALVGCGRIGTLHAEAIVRAPRVRLVAVCDSSELHASQLSRRLGVKSYDSIDPLLAVARPQAVFVATSDDQHFGPALAALTAGCHVFCEKPLAGSVDEARELVAKADERGLHLAVNYNRRYGFGYRTAKRFVAAGLIGPVSHVAIHVTDRTPAAPLNSIPAVMLTTLLTHHFDLVNWLGGPVEQVAVCHATRFPHSQLWSDISLSFRLAEGRAASVVGRYRDGQAQTVETCRIGGEIGDLVIDNVTGGVTLTYAKSGLPHIVEPDTQPDEGTFYDTIGLHVLDYLDCLVHNRQPPITGHDGLIGLRIAAAAERAGTSGQSQEL